jgi:hypothetical protein
MTVNLFAIFGFRKFRFSALITRLFKLAMTSNFTQMVLISHPLHFVFQIFFQACEIFVQMLIIIVLVSLAFCGMSGLFLYRASAGKFKNKQL